MITSRHSIIIHRQPADVWAFLMDLNNYAMWTPYVTAMTASDGLNQGSQITYESSSFGKTWTTQAEITRNTGRQFTLQSKTGSLHVRATYAVLAHADGTEFSLEASFEASSMFRLAEPLIQSVYDNNTAASLKSLKQLLEAGVDHDKV